MKRSGRSNTKPSLVARTRRCRPSAPATPAAVAISAIEPVSRIYLAASNSAGAITGLLLVALSLPRGVVSLDHYGAWDRLVV